ncbi:beta keto-acyl synthase [Lujinxingia litoralis]|uniref:Beta keto-acyl synthase n=1 Tax=Lujinxingia litoralis TaxID=2211119 RepID=A0A328C1E6_9DELT|nr:beta-ketoacyl synthase N-terminal-like domain-containing protein [Lujinxingia litoralis]RAL20438.1 beta keto-acyl synthase [Lujinxingia litoralis]
MKRPTPVAIVGQSCIFPGSLSPEAFWQNLLAGRDLLSPPAPGRWRAEPARAMGRPGWNNPGGYVRGFETIFDPQAYGLDAELLRHLDPLVQWSVHTAKIAYEQARNREQGRLAIYLGNLSLPSEGMARQVEEAHLPTPAREALARTRSDAHRRAGHYNRHMSGLPAHLVAHALGRPEAPAMALDAACASSLYAIKLGMERLRARTADLVLAGAVNRADPLFLNIGFQALQALSPTGQSRPFHRDADGLVPTEGCAFIALKRLDDALDCGDTILGVIHEVGLSNDGRSDGLLVPSSEGQIRALRAAYARCGVRPEDLSYIECHATGTALGDGRELHSLQALFPDQHDEALPIGSLKSNMGHAITAAGMAGLLKILASFSAHQLAPTIHCDAPLESLDHSAFRVVRSPEPWDTPRKVAALSAFGFGGNNSHLLVESWTGKSPAYLAQRSAKGSFDRIESNSCSTPGRADTPSPVSSGAEIAVVALATLLPTGQLSHTLLNADQVDNAPPERRRLSSIDIPLQGLRFPPRDLEVSAPQQLAMLRVAIDAAAQTEPLPRERTGVFVGMQTDPDVVRHGVRARQHALPPEQRNAIAPPLSAAAVIGGLPNIVANRLNAHFDLGGASLTTSAEELGGVAALEEAIAAIRRGELDAAIVGAVELADDLEADAAVALILKRRDLAEADNDTILATLPEDSDLRDAANLDAALPPCGSARGLLAVAAAIALPEHALPRVGNATGLRAATVLETTSALAAPHRLALQRAPRPVIEDAPRVHFVKQPAAAFIVAATDDELTTKVARLSRHTEHGEHPGEGVYPLAGDAALRGQIAQVFTGAAASYHGMGQGLLLAFPKLVDDLRHRFTRLDAASRWMTHPDAGARPTPLDKLFAASVLAQLHNDLTTGLLGIDFDAALGFSSGETNALFATGVWRDFDDLYDQFSSSGAFTRALGGQFDVLKKAWAKHLAPDEVPRWESWRVVGPQEAVEAAIADEPLVRLTLFNAPDDVTIGGHAPAIARVLKALPEHRASDLHYDIAVHIPELGGFQERWLKLHTRTCHPTRRRLYSHAFLDHYEPSAPRVAEALLGQAMRPVNFPALINAAYEDGVRIFVEHGPRTTLGPWIKKTLGDRPHLCVSLDAASDTGLRPLANAIARLAAAGVSVNWEAYNAHLELATSPHSRTRRDPSGGQTSPRNHATLSYPAHWSDYQISSLEPSRHPKPGAPARPFLSSADDPIMPEKPTQLPRAPRLPRVSDPAIHAPASAPTVEAPLPANLPVGAPVPLTAAQPPTSVAPAGPGVLPPYFDLQRQAYQRYLQVLATQSEVHRAFLAQTQRAWQLAQTGQPASQSTSQGQTSPGIDAAFPRSTTPRTPRLSPTFYKSQGQTSDTSRGQTSRTYSQPHSPAANTTRGQTSDTSRGQTSHTSGGQTSPGNSAESSSPAAPRPVGPTFSRADLEVLASGKISQVLGPLFSIQDDFPRQVRMPEPPLLLADRVTGIDAEPGVVSTGTIWTETDITPEAWYLHRGHIPAGVMIEAGQADLLLISWMGADFQNRGERIYRLLGCELTYRGGLPQAGDTLKYDIHIDGHANQGPIRIFFFHYDCRVGDDIRLSVRQGQAGFFSDAELAESMGVLWTPEKEELEPAPEHITSLIDPAQVPASWSADQVQAFADGRPGECFGTGYERLLTHTLTPAIHAGNMCLMGAVEELDPSGGPWGRGYLRSRLPITPDHWFFEGHFKNDPCMPGTLMFEAGMQAMSFYMAACGLTLERDGWRFEPVPDVPYQLRCRGQVTPSSRELCFELYVEELTDPTNGRPTLRAHIMATVDGLKAFHCRSMQMHLVPDTPMGERLACEGLPARRDPRAVTRGGVTHDRFALEATGIGPATACMGPAYQRYQDAGRMPRLPGDPFQFMTRVAEFSSEPGQSAPGDEVVVEYDLPDDAWYFDHNDRPVVPYAVLLEAALQPCGWLSLTSRAFVDATDPLYYRNLDGQATLLAEFTPGGGTLRTHAKMINQSCSGSMIIQSFEVRCTIDDMAVYELTTTFGFFPKAALQNQIGLPLTDRDSARLAAPANVVIDHSWRASCSTLGQTPQDELPAIIDLSSSPDPEHPELWPDTMLRMIDRLSSWEESAQGVRLRTEKDVDPAEWFFKAHFFQDPVQPGSLGVEAMIQSLRYALLRLGLHRRFENPIIEPLALGEAMTWKYRGQVIPENKRITVLLDLHTIKETATSTLLVSEAWLFIDGLKIYHTEHLSLRVLEAHP